MPGGETSRSRQRKYALRVLYEVDLGGATLKEVLDSKRKAGEESPRGIAVDIIEGVTKNREKIDRVIAEYARGWDIGRMPVIDINILRMSMFELFFMEDIPPGATIDEAVEMAKVFSTDDSGRFINGVLGRINRDREEGKISL